MEYHGKLYGHLGNKRYFDTSHTTDDWDAMVKRISELEAENEALRLHGVMPSVEQINNYGRHQWNRGYLKLNLIPFQEWKH